MTPVAELRVDVADPDGAEEEGGAHQPAKHLVLRRLGWALALENLEGARVFCNVAPVLVLEAVHVLAHTELRSLPLRQHLVISGGVHLVLRARKHKPVVVRHAVKRREVKDEALHRRVGVHAHAGTRRGPQPEAANLALQADALLRHAQHVQSEAQLVRGLVSVAKTECARGRRVGLLGALLAHCLHEEVVRGLVHALVVKEHAKADALVCKALWRV